MNSVSEEDEMPYAKGGGWLPFIGESVTLCARATRAILNHAPIGEFRQRFFPAECTQCLCGHCQVETHRHIFANCRWFAYFPLTDLAPTVKDFVKFLKEHPNAFAFFFFFFFVQKFITQCSIAVRGRLSTTSSLHGPQGPDCPITGKRHYQCQRRNLT